MVIFSVYVDYGGGIEKYDYYHRVGYAVLLSQSTPLWHEGIRVGSCSSSLMQYYVYQCASRAAQTDQ